MQEISRAPRSDILTTAAEGVDGALGREEGVGETRRGDQLRVGLAALVVVMVAALALLLIMTLQASRQDALDAARASTVNLARVLADGAARSMDSVDVALTSVVTLAGASPVLLGGEHPAEISAGALARHIKDHLSYTPVLRQIVVTDADGRVLHDSSGRLTGGRISLQPYLDGLEATRRAMLIGQAEERRFIGGDSTPGLSLIPAARRIEGPDGRLLGMVLGAINPLHFLITGSLLDLGPGGWTALYRYDGRPLSGGSGAPIAPEVAAALKRREESGVRIAVMSDGVERVVSYRATSLWPLVLEVGVTKEAALADWRQSLTELGLPLAVVALALLILTSALMRAMQRRARDEAVMVLSDQALLSVKSGVAIVDMRKRNHPIIYVNPAMSEITGLPKSRLLAVLGEDSGSLADDSGIVDDGLALLRTAAMLNSKETTDNSLSRRGFRRDDQVVWADVMISRVSVGESGATHAVLVVNDVSEQVFAEQNLRRSLDELAQLHNEQSRFAEILAHHMQEPVRRIVAHGQLLKRALPAPLPDDAESILKVLERSTKRLKYLLRDVELYLSAGNSFPVVGEAEADVALVNVLQRQRSRLDQAGAQVLRSPLPRVRMAIGPLTEVLSALVDNAISYRSRERLPVITVDATRHGVEWVICVEDNGVGIDQGYYSRIFQVFERLHNEEGRHGTGIGLALARKLVERAGGRIWVNSQPGVGSRFFVALPAADEAEG